MARTSSITIEMVLKAIKGSGGNVSVIRDRLGLKDWSAAKAHVDKYEETRRAYADETEVTLDLAENRLINKVNGGDLAAIKYYLSKKGKHRGYGDKIEIEGSNELKITIED